MKEILIFAGEGVGDVSLQAATETLSALLPRYSVRHTNAAELRKPTWHFTTQLLVFPGGADLPYCAALNGTGTTSIREFVHGGGRYAGFCAGAYFARSFIEFEVGTPSQVVGSRELALFSGRGIGQALNPGTYNYNEGRSATIARLHVMASNEKVPVYFEGGCYFDSGESAADVIARYEDIPGKPAAVIGCSFGSGKVVLCGPHPEFSPRAAGQIRSEVGAALQPYDSLRLHFMRSLLQRLGLSID